MSTRTYWLAFALCAGAATVPLLLTPVLPMADLPQHMAQVAMWKHMGDACHGYSALYDLNLARPYLLGYGLARLLATVLTVSVAFKVTVSIAIVLLPLSLRALLARGAGDSWLSLLGFPLAYGYSFYWGFLNFTLAIPLAVFYFALLFDKQRRAPAAITFGALLFAAHALMFVYCAVITIAIAIAKRTARPLLALTPGAVLFAAFSMSLQQAERAATERAWLVFEPKRLLDLASQLFANAWEPAGLALVAVMAVAIAITRPNVTRDRARWTFFALALLLFVITPFGAYGSAYLYPRFAVMIAVSALFLFDAPQRRQPVVRVLILALTLGWMAILAGRFSRFGTEVREFEAVIERIPANRRIVQFNVDAYSEHVPGPVFWHFGALYQVRRGGLSAWSFANYYPQIVRYKKGAEPVVTSKTTPVSGIDWPGVLQYDYLLLRGSDPRRTIFRERPVQLVARSGPWWLFETPRARGPQRDCPPLNE